MQVFEIDPPSKVTLMKKLIELHDLITETEKTFRQLDGYNHDLYLSGFPRLRAAVLPVNMEEVWSGERILTPEMMALLQICGERLEATQPEAEIEPNILGDIQGSIRGLLSELQDVKVDPKLRLVLTDLLNAALRSILSYELGGIKRVRRDLFSILALIEEQHELLKKEAESPLVKKFGEIVQTIDRVTATAQKIQPILEYGRKWTPLLIDIVGKVQ